MGCLRCEPIDASLRLFGRISARSEAAPAVCSGPRLLTVRSSEVRDHWAGIASGIPLHPERPPSRLSESAARFAGRTLRAAGEGAVPTLSDPPHRLVEVFRLPGDLRSVPYDDFFNATFGSAAREAAQAGPSTAPTNTRASARPVGGRASSTFRPGSERFCWPMMPESSMTAGALSRNGGDNGRGTHT